MALVGTRKEGRRIKKKVNFHERQGASKSKTPSSSFPVVSFLHQVLLLHLRSVCAYNWLTSLVPRPFGSCISLPSPNGWPMRSWHPWRHEPVLPYIIVARDIWSSSIDSRVDLFWTPSPTLILSTQTIDTFLQTFSDYLGHCSSHRKFFVSAQKKKKKKKKFLSR